jgi:hypothetical protein
MVYLSKAAEWSKNQDYLLTVQKKAEIRKPQARYGLLTKKKAGRIMGIVESFQNQPSSHQFWLPRDSEYNLKISFSIARANRPAVAAVRPKMFNMPIS